MEGRKPTKKKIFTLPSVTQVIYCKTLNQCLSACNLIKLTNEMDYSIWSFDCEWYVDYQPGKTNPVALIQFCRQTVVILFHISVYGLPQDLVDILLNPRIIKVGVNINGDIQKLIRDFPTFFARGMPNGCDLRRLSEVTGIPPSQSLAGMVETELGLYLPKPDHTRCSNWEQFPLTNDQISYAALDVIAGYQVFQKLIERWRQLRGIAATLQIPFLLSPDQSSLPVAVDGNVSDALYIMITKNCVFSHPTHQTIDQENLLAETQSVIKRPRTDVHLEFESLILPLSPVLINFLNDVIFRELESNCKFVEDLIPPPRYLSSKLHCYSLWKSGQTITQIMKSKSIKLSTVYSYILDCIDVPLEQLKSDDTCKVQTKCGLNYSLSKFDINRDMIHSILSTYLDCVSTLQAFVDNLGTGDITAEKENQIDVNLVISRLHEIKMGRIVPFTEINDVYVKHEVKVPPEWMIRLVSIHFRRKYGNNWIEKLTDNNWLVEQLRK